MNQNTRKALLDEAAQTFRSITLLRWHICAAAKEARADLDDLDKRQRPAVKPLEQSLALLASIDESVRAAQRAVTHTVSVLVLEGEAEKERS